MDSGFDMVAIWLEINAPGLKGREIEVQIFQATAAGVLTERAIMEGWYSPSEPAAIVFVSPVFYSEIQNREAVRWAEGQFKRVIFGDPNVVAVIAIPEEVRSIRDPHELGEAVCRHIKMAANRGGSNMIEVRLVPRAMVNRIGSEGRSHEEVTW